jgi:outer membrane protein assembly factor BamB
MHLPATPTQKIRIVGGPVSLPAPVVAGDTVFVGDQHHEIMRIDLPRPDAVWRVPAAGYFPEAAFGEVLVLFSLVGYRGMRFSGELTWTLESQGGKRRWGRYGDRFLSFNPGISVADAITGEVIDHHEIRGPLISGVGRCGRILLLGAEKGGDPTRAYDLTDRRVLWERALTEELRSASMGRQPLDQFFYMFCGSSGSFVARYARSLFGVSLIDGRVLWHTPLYVGSNPPVTDGGRIYAWTWSTLNAHEQHLVCLDETTGAVVYKNSLAKYGGEFALYQDALVGRPVAGHLAFGTRSGLVALFRLSDGELVWSYKNKAQVYWPVIAGNRLLVPTAEGTLLVFEGS